MSNQAKPKKLITLMQLWKIILILSLVMWLPVHQVNALGVHYELDKSYYCPGDSGKLILVVRSEILDSDRLVFQAFMEIEGIGKFEWDTTGFAEAPNLPPDVHAYPLAKGQTVEYIIPFKIPSDAKPGDYRYTWTIVMGPTPFGGDPFSRSDTLRILAVGEVPPPPSANFPWLLIAIPILILIATISILVKKLVKKKNGVSHVGIGIKEKPKLSEDKKTTPSKTELYIRKILGILILVSALPFAIFFGIASMGLSLLSILTIIVIFSVYLLRNKGYHFTTDLFFVCIGLVAYIVPAPIFIFGLAPVAPLTMLKGFFLTADWAHEGVGINNPELYLFFSALNIFFFSSVLFLFITDIFSKIKAVTDSNRRGLIVGLTFLAIFGIVFTLPWFHKIQIGMGGGMGAGGPGPNGGIMLAPKTPPEKTTVNFDAEKGVWVYQIELISTAAENAEIIGLKGKSMTGNTVQIAPPFLDNIEIIGGNKSNEKIIIGPTVEPGPPEPGKPPALKPALLRIYSNDPLLLITWIEKNNRTGWQISFWR